MKKIIIVLLSIFCINSAFSQTDVRPVLRYSHFKEFKPQAYFEFSVGVNPGEEKFVGSYFQPITEKDKGGLSLNDIIGSSDDVQESMSAEYRRRIAASADAFGQAELWVGIRFMTLYSVPQPKSSNIGLSLSTTSRSRRTMGSLSLYVGKTISGEIEDRTMVYMANLTLGVKVVKNIYFYGSCTGSRTLGENAFRFSPSVGLKFDISERDLFGD